MCFLHGSGPLGTKLYLSSAHRGHFPPTNALKRAMQTDANGKPFWNKEKIKGGKEKTESAALEGIDKKKIPTKGFASFSDWDEVCPF